jgi:hypothetical protein
MKRRKLIYWISTGLVCGVMIFSVLSFTLFDYTLYPEGAFEHLHLPYYFKIELTTAKILGILTLLLPGIPPKLKEFAYFGFGITLLSASIAHFATGDGILYIIDPLIFLGILVVSYTFYNKLRTEA